MSSWHALSVGAGPVGRSSHVAACISRRLYIFGGENVPRVPVDDTVHVLDLDTRQWSAVQPASAAAAGSAPSWPCARVGAAGTACNGKLFVHGGRTEYNHMQTMSDLWAFDASSSTWALIEQQGQAPGPLSYHAMTSCGDFLYIFGGCKTEGRSNELHRFDTTSGAWTQLIAPNAPSPRGGPATVALPDGSVHVLFGYDGKCEQSDHYVFSGSTWSRIEVSPSPPARSVTDAVYLSGVGTQGSLLVCGGEFTPSAQGHEGAGEYHGDTWLFDLASSTWSSVEGAQPQARGWFSTSVTGPHSAVISGGFDGVERRNDVHEIRLL